MAMHDKDRREYHPAVSILSWLLFALAVELAAPLRLLWFVLPAFLLLARGKAFSRFLSLVWKARWLWIALMLLYAWTIPGTFVFPSEYSPSEEGLNAGVVRIARLVLLLAALAWILDRFNPQQLAGGIYLLAKPFAWLGLDTRAVAVRLALTLEQVEKFPKGRKLLDQLKFPVDLGSGTEEIRLVLPSAGIRDFMIMLAALAMLGTVFI